MELQEAIERLIEIRDRYEKDVKMLEETNAILKNTSYYEILGERRADFEAVKTVFAELDKQKQVKAEMRKVAWEEGYNQGYNQGYIKGVMDSKSGKE